MFLLQKRNALLTLLLGSFTYMYGFFLLPFVRSLGSLVPDVLPCFVEYPVECVMFPQAQHLCLKKRDEVDLPPLNPTADYVLIDRQM